MQPQILPIKNRYNANILLLIIAVLACIAFTCSAVWYAFDISKYLLLLVCTSLIFYFLVAITFIQYIVFKEATYFFYIMYILLNIGYCTIIIPAYPNSHILMPTALVGFVSHLPILLLVLSYYMYVQFAIHFLRLKASDKKSYNLLKLFGHIYIGLFTIAIVAALLLVNSYWQSIIKSIILLLCMPMGICSIVVIYVRAKNVIATILCLGSLLFFLGSVLGFLFSSNIFTYPTEVFPFNTWIFYTEMGTMLESIMFFSSFAYRNKIIIDEEIKGRKNLDVMRNNIAKDLHDEIGSTLSSINILSHVSANSMELQPMQAKLMINQIAMQSKDMQQCMSDIVWSLRSENIAIESLTTRIREYAAQTLEPLQIKATIQFDNALTQHNLPIAYRKELLLICKEAINNIAKHSGATEANVSIRQSDNNYLLLIKDNGSWKGASTGTGTKSMQERAMLINGSLTIQSNTHGTIVKAIVPIP